MTPTALAIETAALYLRRAPFVKGRWRLVHALQPLLRRVGANMGQRIVRTRYGFRLHVDLADWIGQHIYLTGDWERPASELIQSLAGKGDTVVDVGANIGFFSLLASKCVGSSGRVMAFEPVASTCGQLRANLALNRADDVAVHETALSNIDGVAVIHEGPNRNKGLSSLRPFDGAAAQRSVTVARFDNLDIGESKVRLIKIDVEGAEQLVIEGMMRTLEMHRPYLIIEITESFLAEFGHSAASLCRLLRPLGYHMQEITDNHGPIALPKDSRNWPPQFNALFSPQADTVR